MTEQAEQVTQTAQNSGKSQTSLEIRHLVKRYANADKPVLDDISFDVPHGKVFVIVGPSGSGKSTLLRTIAGLEPIQGGTIALNGEIIETGKPGTESAGRSKRGSELRTRVGMVFQSYDLFPNKTVLGNITASLRRSCRSATRRRSRRKPSLCWNASDSPTARMPGRMSCPEANASAWPSAVR